MPDEPFGTGSAIDRAVAVRETHIGVVFLVGDRAYKLKKPVDVGFLDFTTRERRLAACLREVELNRRLAPDVYDGVLTVSGPDGTPCEHLVAMRRMPDDRRLSTLVRSGQPVADVLRSIARLVAAFHTRADRSPAIRAEGDRDALRGRWEASFRQLRALVSPLPEELLADVERLVREFLAGRQPLFTARLADDRIVDGHGDLLADDIFCLDDGPRVLDCLEFDDRLRWVDGLDDIAFLAMDLERLGAPALAGRLLDWYAEFVDDPAPRSLREHYVAYRAFVRAKVACVRYDQGLAAAAQEAVDYARLALRHLDSGRVRLVLVGGLPATGKSTVAGRLADRMGMVLLSSDRIRKELAGLNPEDRAAASYRDGIYAAAHTERTYTELLARAENLLGRGESVVLDASWSAVGHRLAAADVARRTSSALSQFRCVAPMEQAVARLRQRAPGVSDADAGIAAAMAADLVPWPEAAVLDTTGAADTAVDRALDTLRTDRTVSRIGPDKGLSSLVPGPVST